MDIYRALNADVPQLLFTMLYQADPMVSDEDFTRAVIALHMDIRRRAQAVDEELHHWLQKQYTQQAEETVQKLQRLAALKEDVDLKQLQEALIRDYMRLGSRIGSVSLLGIQGSAEETLSEEAPLDEDLARHFADGREYLNSLGFKPGQGPLHETWLLFRGSIHYDVIEHVMGDLLGIYRGRQSDPIAHIGHTVFSTYNLIYQIGEGLTDDLAPDAAIQEVTFAFSKGLIEAKLAPAHPFHQEVAGLLEQIAGETHVLHASFWQRKLGLGPGKEFVLRLRLPAGEKPLRDLFDFIDASGRVGKETIVKGGKLLLGRRVL